LSDHLTFGQTRNSVLLDSIVLDCTSSGWRVARPRAISVACLTIDLLDIGIHDEHGNLYIGRFLSRPKRNQFLGSFVSHGKLLAGVESVKA
jgi:hypothetical protein